MKKINLTKSKESIIDADDFEKVSALKWYASNNKSKRSKEDHFYAKNCSFKKAIYMHRFILNYSGECVVDHINGNTLDNRKSNLRIVTRKINQNNLTCHRKGNLQFPPQLQKRKHECSSHAKTLSIKSHRRNKKTFF